MTLKKFRTLHLTAFHDFEWSLGQLMMTVCAVYFLRQGCSCTLFVVVLRCYADAWVVFVPGDNTV